MRQRAHAQTPVLLVLFQLVMLVPPFLWWHKHGHPPAWTQWLAFQLAPTVALAVLFAVMFVEERLGNWWRHRKKKNPEH